MTTIGTVLRLKFQLKAYLDHHRMTAAELSRRSGVSKQTISFWMSGGEPRKLVHLLKVARVLSTSLDDLCFGEGVVIETSRGEIERLLGSDWVSGHFEIKIRRITR